VNPSYHVLVDLLESIEQLLNPLDIFTRIPPTPAMNEMVNKIILELLSTLAQTTKELEPGRSGEYVRAGMLH
jgi:hypothetical protein